MSTYIYHDFQDYVGIYLDNIQAGPNSNQKWTSMFGGRLRVNSSGELYKTQEDSQANTLNYVANYTVPQASYVIRATVKNTGYFPEYTLSGGDVGNPMGGGGGGTPTDTVHGSGVITHAGKLRMNEILILQARGSGYSMYRCFYDQLEGLWTIDKKTSGNNAAIDAVNGIYHKTIAEGQIVDVQFVCRGYWLELWLDGVQVIRLRDEGSSAFSLAGTPSIEIFAYNENTDQNSLMPTKGMHILNYKISDEFPPFTISEEIQLTGQGYTNGNVSLNWTQ